MRVQSSLLPVVIATVVLAGCAGARREAATAPAAEPAAPGTASPMSERERYDAERWERATAGLRLTNPSGLAEVDALVDASPLQAARLLAEADAALAENRVFDALERYVLAARNDATHPGPYVGIGRVMQRKGRIDPALTSFRTALDRDAADLAARYELAMTLWTASRSAEAIAEMTAVVTADPAHGGAHERLAVWSYYTGDHAAARRHLAEAERLGQPVPGQLAGLLDRAAGAP